MNGGRGCVCVCVCVCVGGGVGCVGEVIWHKKFQQSFLNQSLNPPPPPPPTKSKFAGSAPASGVNH